MDIERAGTPLYREFWAHNAIHVRPWAGETCLGCRAALPKASSTNDVRGVSRRFTRGGNEADSGMRSRAGLLVLPPLASEVHLSAALVSVCVG